jgi:DnaJ-domain-containing protein 1
MTFARGFIVDELRAKLEGLQAQYDKLKVEIEALQTEIHQAELEAAAEAHLDSLPDDERGVLIQAAAIRVGGKA